MIGRYLGHLPSEDPFHEYLQSHIAPQLGLYSPDARYRVFRFTDSQDVYFYEEIHGAARLVGKFFKSSDPEHARGKGETEFNNLLFLRGLGLSVPPHYVVRPYGFNPCIDNVLVVEYLEGDSLSAIIDSAIGRGKGDRLYRKLAALAHFLAVLHHRTASAWTVNFDESHQYMGRLLKSLIEKRGLGQELSDKLRSLGEAWLKENCMWEDCAVLVHGDATPSNLLFGKDSDVMAIDLERMRWADRVFDLGRLCGELKHLFFRATGNWSAAEPFIGHFLWEYCCHFPDRESTFFSVTRRAPFYMGITLLRIARNSWIEQNYRQRLIVEAMNILMVRK
jgi:tRNA A-37 threonylcarbamoyl transferase component Bud32